MNDNSLYRILHIIITILGAIICLIFSPVSAITLVAVSLLLLAFHEYSSYKKRRRILRLCDDIDRILRGSETVSFDDYTEDYISLLAAEIHKMTVRLREQNTALNDEKQFLKESLEDIAHQLRTPLSSMMLLLEIIRKPNLTSQQRAEYINELYTLLSRMNWLIDTMLGHSRIDAGVVNFSSKPVSCRQLIDEAISPVSVTLDIKNITTEINIDGKPSLIGDFQYLTEALLNILKNCIEHTPENGKITITAEENPIFTRITVTDNGDGFSEDDLAHIFERFYRSGNPSKNGYGIGLAFARRIVTSQNGSLQASNAPNGGALFDMRIYRNQTD